MFNDDLLDLHSLSLLEPNTSPQGFYGRHGRGAGNSPGYSPESQNDLRVRRRPKTLQMLDRLGDSCISDEHQPEQSKGHSNLMVRKLCGTYMRQFRIRSDLVNHGGSSTKQQICEETFISVAFSNLNQSFKWIQRYSREE